MTAPASTTASGSSLAVRLRGVTKIYRRGGLHTRALDAVDLDIHAGEVFALLGPNGAGKTTLLYILMGLLTPDDGHVEFPALNLAAGEHPGERINYVSAESRFHWALRVGDILDIFARIYGLTGPRRTARIAALAETFGTADLMGRTFDQLSTGQKMRVIFVKGLLNEPAVLLLDEPTLGLDVHIARTLRTEALAFCRRQGATIILTSHYMAEVRQMASRVAFIRGGRILDIGTPDEVLARQLAATRLVVTLAEPPPAANGPLRDPLTESAIAAAGFTRDPATGQLCAVLPEGQPAGPMLDALLRAGLAVHAVHTHPPDLEDYFVRMMEDR